MKKRLVLLLVTAMAATTVLAGCGSKDSGSSDNGKKSSKEAKVENDDDTLIVGFDASFPPYGYKDDSGEYVGFDLDLAQEVCDRNNWKLVKQPIDWDSKDAELNSGTIDCIWNGFTMNGREDDYTWSDPYIDNKQVVVVRSDSGIDDFAGLKGKHVEVQTDSSALAALEGDQKDLAATFADLNQVAEYNTALVQAEAEHSNVKLLDLREFTRQYPTGEVFDWKFWFISQMGMNPKITFGVECWEKTELTASNSVVTILVKLSIIGKRHCWS